MRFTPQSLRVLLPTPDHVKAAVATLVFVWGLYTFVWKEHISPQYAPHKLKIEARLQPIGQTKDYRLVRINFLARNIGNQTLSMLYDLWRITEVNRQSIANGQLKQDFESRYSKFLKTGEDYGIIERVRKTSNGKVLAAGSLGWNSLKSSESQQLSEVVALPLSSKEVLLQITIPYAKNLNKDSDTWINWRYNKKANSTTAEICTAHKAYNTSWHCVPEGDKDYNRLLQENEIRFAHDESAYVL
jgi:hypothetical protein